MLGITDKPIDKISEDMFNMNAQIKGLCNYIKKCDTPMTISIQGDWGSGKTSLMNMVKSEIESDVCSIWFNAWQFSQFNLKDELSTSLISYLLHELGENKESINKTIGIISGTSKLISQIMTASFLGKDASDTIGEWFGSHTLNSAGEIKGLKDKFQKAVESKLKKEKKSKAVIYIDDLDRLQPEKSVELLEVIKMFLDCESCVFILAIDYEVVTQGLSQKYGENIGAEKGKEYFDKFIQLSFDMPIKERMYDVGNYLSNLMPELIGVEIPPDNYINALNYSIGYNPRGIKRFSNMYMLYLSIIKELRSSLDEETKMILFMLLCMKIAYEEVVNYIINLGIEAKSSLIDELINEMYEDQFLIEDIQNYTEQKKKNFLAF